MMRKIIVLVSILLCATAHAADYYVSPGGTTAWPECTTQGSPCLAGNSTAGRAFLAAQAGDTVWFLDGTYAGIEQDAIADEQIAAWVPANSGTALSPITFRAQHKHAAVLRGLTSGVSCNVIGAYSTDYIVWDGFSVEAVNGSGGRALAGARFYDSIGSKLLNTKITGGSHSTGATNNYEGLRVHGSSYFTAANCTIKDFVETTTNTKNTSAIKTYYTSNSTFSNCDISNSSVGIYVKMAGQDGITIENNFIHDMTGNGVDIEASTGAIKNIVMRNNVFSAVSSVLDADTDGSVSDSLDGLVVESNSAMCTVGGVTWDAGHGVSSGPVVANNIVSAPTNHIISRTVPAPYSPKSIDYNCYSGGAFKATLLLYHATDEETYTDLALWQASGALYASANPDVHSFAANPQWANATGSMSEIADFALAPGSPCIGTGRDGATMGADVTLVGVMAEIADPDTTTTSGPILRTGSHLLRVGDSVLRVQ